MLGRPVAKRVLSDGLIAGSDKLANELLLPNDGDACSGIFSEPFPSLAASVVVCLNGVFPKLEGSERGGIEALFPRLGASLSVGILNDDSGFDSEFAGIDISGSFGITNADEDPSDKFCACGKAGDGDNDEIGELKGGEEGLLSSEGPPMPGIGGGAIVESDVLLN